MALSGFKTHLYKLLSSALEAWEEGLWVSQGGGDLEGTLPVLRSCFSLTLAGQGSGPSSI